jgi:hypothetical protein
MILHEPIEGAGISATLLVSFDLAPWVGILCCMFETLLAGLFKCWLFFLEEPGPRLKQKGGKAPTGILSGTLNCEGIDVEDEGIDFSLTIGPPDSLEFRPATG